MNELGQRRVDANYARVCLYFSARPVVKQGFWIANANTILGTVVRFAVIPAVDDSVRHLDTGAAGDVGSIAGAYHVQVKPCRLPDGQNCPVLKVRNFVWFNLSLFCGNLWVRITDPWVSDQRCFMTNTFFQNSVTEISIINESSLKTLFDRAAKFGSGNSAQQRAVCAQSSDRRVSTFDSRLVGQSAVGRLSS
jgi:hypothetical protein